MGCARGVPRGHGFLHLLPCSLAASRAPDPPELLVTRYGSQLALKLLSLLWRGRGPPSSIKCKQVCVTPRLCSVRVRSIKVRVRPLQRHGMLRGSPASCCWSPPRARALAPLLFCHHPARGSPQGCWVVARRRRARTAWRELKPTRIRRCLRKECLARKKLCSCLIEKPSAGT